MLDASVTRISAWVACVMTIELYLPPLHDAATRVANEPLVWRQ